MSPVRLRNIFVAFFAFSSICRAGDSSANDTVISTHVTWDNASAEAGEESEFPEDLFTEAQRKQGAIVLHVILAVYCFAAIATVCTQYFMPTIRCICEDLNISDDVAAATFMSTATASPEFFTNVIGTFVTHSDIGVGHVLGNAYYDMFFVAAVGGLAAKKYVQLDWWPITRDCFIYLIVAITLTLVIWDGVVTTVETAILLVLYVLYFFIMFCNRKIITLCKSRFNIDMKDPVEDELKTSKPRGTEVDKKNRQDLQEAMNPLTSPAPLEEPTKEENRIWSAVQMVTLQPLIFLTSITIPDVRKSGLRKFYPFSFVMCVVWIGVATYFCTWMISTIGRTIGVPDSIMGIMFMAAGGSVVEVYAVFYKVRRGECSIGLSNSMGCNTLDVTLCMALPWFIKCILPSENSTASNVIIRSPGIQYNCLLLIVSVIILFTLFCINKFRLSKIMGVICAVTYASVLAIAVAMEAYG